MKLENEGWPIKSGRDILSYARHESSNRKTEMSVKRKYNGEYLNVSNELQIINRIKERYKFFQSNHIDKQKYKKTLYSSRHKGPSYEADVDINESD